MTQQSKSTASLAVQGGDAIPLMSVSQRGLIERIKRALRHDGLRLRTCRENSRSFNDLGRFYVVNDRNHLVESHLDLEEVARDLSVL